MQVVRKSGFGVVISLLLGLVIACGGESPDREAQLQNDVTTDAGVADTAGDAASDAGAEVVAAVADNGVRVVLATNVGDIELSLDEEKAPVSVANFLSYVDSGHYDGTIFHRVIPGFMVQGGGFTEALVQKPTQDPIVNEATNGLKNLTYSIAMARTGVVNSATTQFFINVADNAFLDHTNTSQQGFGYAVFGSVVSGQEVIDQIAAVQTGAAGRFSQDVPVEAIVIESATRK